jgi:hypothetical protein
MHVSDRPLETQAWCCQTYSYIKILQRVKNTAFTNLIAHCDVLNYFLLLTLFLPAVVT